MSERLDLCPIAGYEFASLPDQCVLMRLAYITEPGQTADKAITIPFAMTAAQARELAQYLVQTAEAAEQRTDSFDVD